MPESTTLEVVIQGKDQFSATANKVSGSLKNLEKTAGQIGGHMAQGFRQAGRNLERLALSGAALAAGGGALAVKWAGDFQAQLNTINTIAFATPEALGKIGDSIRTIAKDTGIATEDLTQAYYDLLSAGVKAKDAQELLNDAVTLGIGGLATTQQTVDLLTTAYNAYGLTAKGATKATDMFAQAVADGKVTAAQIAESFANVASIAKTAHVGINQVAAAYAFLTAQGVPAAEVTTEMQRAIVSLMKPLPELEKAQKKLKINFMEEVAKKGLVPALQELREYADKNKIPLIELLGRIEAVKFVLQTTGPNAAGFAKELDSINNSAGMAAKQMDERQQGFNYQMAVLKANIKDAGITIGTALLPALADLAAEFSNFLKGHQGDIQGFAKGLASGFRDAVKWAKSLDWKSIGDALKNAAGFAKGVVQAFADAPAWLQTAVLTGWGLNKLTGGAVTNIFGDIAKGIGGQLLQRGSSPANPLWVQSVTGGGGVPGAPAAGGAGIAATVAGAGFLLGVDAAVQSIAHNPVMGQVVANSFGVKTQGQSNMGAGPGGSMLQQIIQQARIDNGTTTGPTGMGPGGNGAASRGGFISHAVDAFKANTEALRANSRRLGEVDSTWAKNLDEDVHSRSVKKYGGKGLGKSAEDATYNRDILRRADGIVKGSQDQNTKLARLQGLLKDSKNATDATKRKLSSDIKGLSAAIKKQPILVNVQAETTVKLDGRKIAQANASTSAYGKYQTGQVL